MCTKCFYSSHSVYLRSTGRSVFQSKIGMKMSEVLKKSNTTNSICTSETLKIEVSFKDFMLDDLQHCWPQVRKDTQNTCGLGLWRTLSYNCVTKKPDVTPSFLSSYVLENSLHSNIETVLQLPSMKRFLCKLSTRLHFS